jgi:glycosyltransferase involved in cell wall biosynthesis
MLAPRWPKLRLVIVGQGPERDALEALATELGIGAVVRFAGLRPQVPSFHYLFDVSVLCSVSEGFPNSLVEAMAAERPIVATDVGGVRDAVRDGETGLLVPPGSPTQLAEAIESLLGDPSLRQAMGKAGSRIARERFHARVVIASLQDLYDRLLLNSRQSVP